MSISARSPLPHRPWLSQEPIPTFAFTFRTGRGRIYNHEEACGSPRHESATECHKRARVRPGIITAGKLGSPSLSAVSLSPPPARQRWSLYFPAACVFFFASKVEREPEREPRVQSKSESEASVKSGKSGSVGRGGGGGLGAYADFDFADTHTNGGGYAATPARALSATRAYYNATSGASMVADPITVQFTDR